MSDHESIAVIGAGQAGYWASKTLRDQGFAGRIALIGEEAHPPYERPPISKSVLLGTEEPEVTHFCTPDELEASQIEWMPRVRVEGIDRAARRLVLSSGAPFSYDRLLIATGGRARKLPVPGADLKGIHYLRTIDDSTALRPLLKAGEPLLVIGGGWIGLEVAASAARRGMRVLLVEAAPQLCNRMLPASPAEYLQRLHATHGVDIRLGCSVERFIGQDAIEGAVLSSGETLPVRTVVAGIGMVPNSELAAQCGLEVRDGILVDQFGITSDPSIYAAGDVACYTSRRTGERIRSESWSNAQNQAIAVAKTMAGVPTAYDPVPWFWSDQYDLNLQIAGTPKAAHKTILRGRMETGAFSIFYLETDGTIGAVLSFNAARENRIGKRLLEQGARVESSQLSDPAFSLQKLLG